MTLSYELLDHTADLGVRVFADSEAGLYRNALTALADLLCGPIPSAGAKAKTIRVTGEDRTEILVNLLREALYLFEGEKLLLAGVRGMELFPGGLSARLGVVAYDPEVHEIRHAIKAVTWHQALAGPQGKTWEARVIFDV